MITIQKVTKKGLIRYRVNEQRGANGKRQRKFFPSMEAAKAYAAERKSDREQFGMRFGTLTNADKMEIFFQLQRLKPTGYRLRDAVDFVLKYHKVPLSMPLERLASEFLLAKEAKALRPRSLRTLRASVQLFLVGRRETTLREITAADIREFLTRNGWAHATVRSYLTDIRNLFNFAVRQGYLEKNPAMAVEMPCLDDKPPGILSVPQCRSLLAVCRFEEPTLLPTLILSLLAGLRPEEAQRMQWEDFLPDHIEVKASKAKTRRRRLVPITPQLRAWLDLAKAKDGELPVVNFAKKFNRVRQLTGVYEGWPHDALRHSFASYHLAAYRNENETANVMGNSPQMIYGHYREVVPQKDGEAFFSLMPGDCSAEVVSALATRTELQSKQGRGTKGKPLLGLDTLTEIFQRNGGQPMSKKELFAALRAQGVSDSTAYHALSANGHLRKFLADCEGRLSLAQPAT